MSPARGDWVSFHPSEPGRAHLGQVTAQLTPNRYGRCCYRVAYWRERSGKAAERAEDEVSADRLIAVTRPPQGMTPLLSSEEVPS